jgi:hypothetical protein
LIPRIRILSILILVLSGVLTACAESRTEPMPPAVATATFEAARSALAERRSAERTQTAAARPTLAPSPTPTTPPLRATATPRPTATPLTFAQGLQPNFVENVSDLQGFMPILSDIGEWYLVTAEGPRSADMLANSYPDPDAHRERLANWGFQRAAHRTIEYYSEGPDDIPDGVDQLQVTVSEFDTPEHAFEALEWEQAYRHSAQDGLEIIEHEHIGDASRALAGHVGQGSGEAAYWAYIWVQIGTILLSAHGSAHDDRFEDVAAIIRHTVETRPNALGAPMPTLDDLQAGFYVYAEETMASEDVAMQFEEEVDPDHHLERLEAWGYERGFTKFFAGEGYLFSEPLSQRRAAPGGVVAVSDDTIEGVVVIGLSVSVYASPEAAAEATEYHWSIIRDSDPSFYQDVDVPNLGDRAWGLGNTGSSELYDGHLAMIFVQHGNREYFVVGVSFFDTTLIDLVAITQETLDRE